MKDGRVAANPTVDVPEIGRPVTGPISGLGRVSEDATAGSRALYLHDPRAARGGTPEGQPAGAGGARLENNADNSSLPAKGLRDRTKVAVSRRARYRLRAGVLWGDSSLERVRKCGKVSRAENGLVGGRVHEGRAGFSGLATCGSPWACPPCAAKIAAKRAEDLRTVLAWATAQGHTVAMFTTTVQHHKKHTLAELWDAEMKAWSSVTSGGRWQKMTAQYGILGWVRAFEATHGWVNGWHPHLHVVVVLEGKRSSAEVNALGGEMFDRWQRSLDRRGYRVSKMGVDMKTTAGSVDQALSVYLSKSLAMEATHGHAKKGRKGGRTPFQILASVLDEGDADSLELWHDWEKTSHNRRQITWSQGIRTLAGMAAQEISDEDAAAEDLGHDDLFYIANDEWATVRNDQVSLLEAGDAGDLAGMLSWMDARGIGYRLTPAGMTRLGLLSPPSAN